MSRSEKVDLPTEWRNCWKILGYWVQSLRKRSNKDCWIANGKKLFIYSSSRRNGRQNPFNGLSFMWRSPSNSVPKPNRGRKVVLETGPTWYFTRSFASFPVSGIAKNGTPDASLEYFLLFEASWSVLDSLRSVEIWNRLKSTRWRNQPLIQSESDEGYLS